MIVIVIAAVGVGGYFLLKGDGEEGSAESGLTPHDPILIVGNDNFTLANGVVGGRGTESDPYIIEGWFISADNVHGIKLSNRTSYFVIHSCVVENGWGGHYDGIYLDNVVNGRIDNNTSENNSYGIHLGDSDNNILDNNTCSNNLLGGIFLNSSTNDTIENNTCEDQHPLWGASIILENSDNNSISNNTSSNSWDGIFLTNSDNNSISNNTSENIGQSIILVNSDNNSISNNTSSNGGAGIDLYESNNNIIYNNTCENNGYHGIYLHDSFNNHIYHNNLVNNATQASDDGSNYWDDGYPSGGNYWSDYTGSDADGDEIGDTPYNLTGDNNQDRYPLMNPI